jgi:hypothetical protein
VDIIGRDRIRIGGAQTFYLVYGNKGNVNATVGHFWLSFPSALGWIVAIGPPPSASEVFSNGELLLGFDVFPVTSGSSGVIELALQDLPAVPNSFQLKAWVN